MKSKKVYCIINAELDGYLQPANQSPRWKECWGKLETAELFTRREASSLAKFFGGSVSISMYAIKEDN